MRKPKAKPATDARSAVSGEFVTKAEAKRRPRETVVTRRKAKPALMWGVRHNTGGIYAAFKLKVNAEGFIYRAAEPDKWRLVRVRVEVAE